MFKQRHRLLFSLVAFLLIPAAIAPYVLFAKNFRALHWAWSNLNFPFLGVLLFACISACACTVLLYYLLDWGRVFFISAALIITLNSALFAMKERQHSLLIIIFFISAILVVLGEWLRKKLLLSYYNSRRDWWEAYPKALPGINASVFNHKEARQKHEVRLANLGDDGCFVFFLQNVPKRLDFDTIEISFSDGKKIDCAINLMMQTKDKRGVGYQFLDSTFASDWYKDLKDEINHLRKAGYVY